MTLAKELMQEIADPTLTQNQRAQLRCQLAKQLEDVGNYEGARVAMRELWSRVGERPKLDDLDQATMPEVLLRTGVLTGWVGSTKQIDGAQEMAKNLISEAIRLFEALERAEKTAEAYVELGVCYWREGAFDEARVTLKEALSRLFDINGDLKALVLMRSAAVEKVTNRLSDAMRLLTEAAPLFEASNNHTIKGRFHNEFAQVLRKLGATECRDDYIDRAFVEYAAASFHFEQAGNTRYHACVENNLGFLFLTVGQFPEAHRHLDRAQALFTSIKDSVHTAQVDDTRTKVLLAEGRISEAEKLARSTVQILDQGDEHALLAEALTTYGLSLARLGRHRQAHLTLRRAVEVAQQAGDLESAGHSALTIIEELGDTFSDSDLIATYHHAVELLTKSRDVATLRRLSVCARRVLFLANVLSTPPDWTGFSFKKAVRRFESRLIEKALRDADGSVTHAARLLDLKHHQSLASMLNTKHQELLAERTPVLPRRRSIITNPDILRPSQYTSTKQVRANKILLVEDNKTVADAVKETLEAEGWKVETCADGETALRKITGRARYDLLLLDNELSGVNGLDLAHHARQFSHRRRTPIIMLSATDCEREALAAGADVFLKKLDDVTAITATVRRMLVSVTESE